ncbi:hypothetical protein JCM21900_001192 [Sporobolomyces salmonicolor]
MSPRHASVSTDDDGDSILDDNSQPSTMETDPLTALLNGIPLAAPPPRPTHAAVHPSGPVCSFGSRLAYTYFPSPAPRPDVLNALTPGRPATEGEPGSLAQPGVHWFTIDDQLVYLSFFQDYGPLNVGCLYRFCLHLHALLEAPEHRHQRIFLYSSDEPDKKVNAALLMALYAMVVMRWSVADVLHPISCLELQPYRDAGYSRSDYHLHPQSILYGVSRALSHQLLDLATFDLAAYEKAEKVEEGDWNWLTPGFVAFASPVESGWTAGGATPKTGVGRLSRAFRNVLDEFEGKGVKVVVRLNKKLYDANHFKERGIDHVEMYFDDGTNPSMEMCRQFIELSDRVISSGGAVAVHCKAGLGRTGTLVGAYLIYKHGFTADEAIGFMRLMRPGSCVGPQQHFLYENQLEWVRWAAQDELRAELAARNPLPVASAIAASSAAAEASNAAARPITPPNEAELARSRATTPGGPVPPTTPRRQIVPGQPRKTPGRSRHAVATPEENTPAGSVQAHEEQMEGVVLTSPQKPKGESSAKGKEQTSMQLVSPPDGEESDDDDIDPLQLVSPIKLNLASAAPISSSARPKTPSNTSSRPTRIARAAPIARPLSAITDNRIVDRLRMSTRAGSASGGGAGGHRDAAAAAVIARSKGAKNLNTVFEAAEGSGQGTTTRQQQQSRYPLRNGRVSPTMSTSTAVAPGSPSKLPTRIPAKRGVAPSSPNPPSAGFSTSNGGGGFGLAPELAKLGEGGGKGAAGGGRNVRRRRSSMGSQDFVQAG